MLSQGYPQVMGRLDTRYSPVRRSPSTVASYRNAAPRLACVKPVASVHPEPGSNSPLYKYPIHFRHDSEIKASSHSSRCSGNCKNVFIFNVSLKETSFVCFSECHPNIRLKSKPPLKKYQQTFRPATVASLVLPPKSTQATPVLLFCLSVSQRTLSISLRRSISQKRMQR